MSEPVKLEVRNNVGHIVLADAERGNPIDQDFCERLLDIVIA